MKKLITLSFLFLINNLCSQVEIDTTRERFIYDTSGYDTTSFNSYYQSKTISALEFIYSSKVYNKSFYNSWNTIDHINFNKSITEIGIGFTGRILFGSTSRYDNSIGSDGHFAYKMILPVQLQLSDSISSRFQGSSFTISCGKDLYHSLDDFDLIVSGGVDVGRILLYNPDYKILKNPFFNPTVSINTRVKIKHFCFSLRIDCWNDISKSSWRPVLASRFSDKNSYSVTNFRQSGIRFSVGVGYSFR